MVYQTARSCAKKRETGHYPQQGGCRRYDGDYERYASGLRGVIHCYSYSAEMAKEYVKMGYYIGIGGVVTFKNAKKLKQVVSGDSFGVDRTGNGLSVPCACSI